MPKPAKLARPARNVRRHTGATLCGAVYFNLSRRPVLLWRLRERSLGVPLLARDVFEFVRGQFVRLVRWGSISIEPSST